MFLTGWYWGSVLLNVFLNDVNDGMCPQKFCNLRRLVVWSALNIEKVEVLSGGTSTAWRNGLMETSWSSEQGNAKSCVYAGIIPCRRTGWIENGFAAKYLGILLDKNLNMNQQFVLAEKKVNWFVLAKVQPVDWEHWSFSSTHSLWEYNWSTALPLVLPFLSTRKTSAYCSEFTEASPRELGGLEHMMYEKRREKWFYLELRRESLLLFTVT